MNTALAEDLTPAPLRLDFGCGKNKREGFQGVDQFPIPGVDIIADLTQQWPWADSSVDEANASHFLEHLTNFNGKFQRVRFFNELWRVLKPGAECSLIFPHWCSNRMYGDPTHCEPFSEMGFYYLDKVWRLDQTPQLDTQYNRDGYSCDFTLKSSAYSVNPSLMPRNNEYQQFALANYKEAAQDIMAVIVARK